MWHLNSFSSPHGNTSKSGAFVGAAAGAFIVASIFSFLFFIGHYQSKALSIISIIIIIITIGVLISMGVKLKLITALKIIEEREKMKRKTEKELQKETMIFRRNIRSQRNSDGMSIDRPPEIMSKIIQVQSVLPEDDILALKEKTGKSSIKEAISEAVYYYLNWDGEE